MPKTNAAGLELIKSFEGLSLRAYPDPGTGGEPWTIGYGHTGGTIHPGETITPEAALAFLEADLRWSENAVAGATEVDLTPNQFSALVSFHYNTGAYTHAAPIAMRVNARDLTGAMEHLMLYVNGGGGPMPGLVRRRTAERALFLTP
jgi:lysozyme